MFFFFFSYFSTSCFWMNVDHVQQMLRRFARSFLVWWFAVHKQRCTRTHFILYAMWLANSNVIRFTTKLSRIFVGRRHIYIHSIHVCHVIDVLALTDFVLNRIYCIWATCKSFLNVLYQSLAVYWMIQTLRMHRRTSNSLHKNRV